MKKEDLRLVFFGTPDFAVASLKAIVDAGYNVVAVVTAPDKAAGRGYQIQMSAVKKAAIELGIDVLQPEKLKSPEFIEHLRSYKADLQIVIAFRMLPELVWNMPPMGTFNLHASLLPAYRGAAPINHAIINGEKTTGVTTFFLKHEIDTGSIIAQASTPIHDDDNAGSLHDRLMPLGAELVVKSLDNICNGQAKLMEQQEGQYPTAPKIFTETCKIDWHQPALKVHNLIRGLSPYPAAFTEFMGKKLKVFKTTITDRASSQVGLIEIVGKDKLVAHCNDVQIELNDVQMEGKKRLSVRDFINGIHH